MSIIWKREWQSFFHTSIGYVFVGVFLALSGVIFYLSNLQTLSGDLLVFLSQLTSLVMLLSPMLTMRLLCEERQKRTDQLLLTSPISLTRVVIGKYFAAASVMLLTICLTHAYVLIIGIYGKIYAGEWFVGYLGFTLQSLSFLALDLLATCFARNQVTAVIAAFAVNFALWIMDLLADYVAIDFVGNALKFISLYDRYQPFIYGQLSYASVVYFVTFICVCLVATVHMLDVRRFSGGGAA